MCENFFLMLIRKKDSKYLRYLAGSGVASHALVCSCLMPTQPSQLEIRDKGKRRSAPFFTFVFSSVVISARHI